MSTADCQISDDKGFLELSGDGLAVSFRSSYSLWNGQKSQKEIVIFNVFKTIHYKQARTYLWNCLLMYQNHDKELAGTTRSREPVCSLRGHEPLASIMEKKHWDLIDRIIWTIVEKREMENNQQRKLDLRTKNR